MGFAVTSLIQDKNVDRINRIFRIKIILSILLILSNSFWEQMPDPVGPRKSSTKGSGSIFFPVKLPSAGWHPKKMVPDPVGPRENPPPSYGRVLASSAMACLSLWAACLTVSLSWSRSTM